MVDTVATEVEEEPELETAEESGEDSLSAAFGNGVRDSGHDVRITRSHDYDMNSQLVREEIASLRLLNSETEQRYRHTEDAHQDNRNLAIKLHDAQMQRESNLQQQAQAQQASQAAIDASNAHVQALAQQGITVKLSGGVYPP